MQCSTSQDEALFYSRYIRKWLIWLVLVLQQKLYEKTFLPVLMSSPLICLNA